MGTKPKKKPAKPAKKPAKKPAAKKPVKNKADKKKPAPKKANSPPGGPPKSVKAAKPKPKRKPPPVVKTGKKVGDDVSYMFSDNSVTVNFFSSSSNGQPVFRTKVVTKDSPAFSRVRDAIREGKLSELPKLISAEEKVRENLNRFKERNIKLVDGSLLINNKEVQPNIAQRIVAFAEEGLPYKPLVNFWKNLQKNPSFRAVNGLFAFLEHGHFPITEDGCFIAYKGVRSNFFDLHSGKFDNSPGKPVSVPRNEVDENPDNACSNGLHVANYDYAHLHYGGSSEGKVTIMVKVNPKDVVCVPRTESEKMRVCAYKSLAISEEEIKSQIHYVEPDDDDYDDDDGDGDDIAVHSSGPMN